MLMEIYIILFLLAFGLFFYSWVSKKWLPALGATILFSVLAFNGFNIEVASAGSFLVNQDITLIYISWGMMFISFITVLIGVVGELKERRSR